jgi:asparagine synthase (glutamine-hydrolysing)
MAFRLPPWATRYAVELVRDRIAVAGHVSPLGASRAQHDAVEAVRVAAHEMRRVEQLSARHGLPLVAPFLDDGVVEIALSVRAHERTTPWHYKPLVVEAMRGIVPDASLARTTKAEGSDLLYRGLRAHRAEVLALTDDMVLARLGLVDAGELRAQCTGLWASDLWPVALSRTLSCERWLRDLADRPAVTPPQEVRT